MNDCSLSYADEILDSLEEYGLNNNEFELLKAIVKNEGNSVDRLSKAIKLKPREIVSASNGLLDLGFIKEEKGVKTTAWIATQKGKNVKRFLTNLHKGTNSNDSVKDCFDKQENYGVYLSNLMEVSKHIISVKEACNVTPRWLQILVPLKGHGIPMTIHQIAAFAEITNIEELESLLKENSIEASEKRWVECVDKKIPTYTLTKTGEEVMELVIMDWKMRLED